MGGTPHGATSSPAAFEGYERFRKLRYLTDHWARPFGPRAYYWYLTFENSPELRALAKHCQDAISLPYYDLTAPGGLHLTLDRIAVEGSITADQLCAIEAAAIEACGNISPPKIAVGRLGGTSGAIGFDAFPGRPIEHLRDVLREVTLSVHPAARIKETKFHPHVAIAYCHSDGVPATKAIAAVEQLHDLPCVEVNVEEATLVLLERRQHSYAWQVNAYIPLAGHG